jgi:hypothetical protein
MNVSKYSVYVTTGQESHQPKKPYGGDHITMAKCQEFNRQTLATIVNTVAEKNVKNELCDTPWKPKKWDIQMWKGRYTMVITSNRLCEVAGQLKKQGVKHLVGPDNGRSKFHVTLPKNIQSKQEAKTYASELSKKNWYLTVVNKEKESRHHWSDYSFLYQN